MTGKSLYRGEDIREFCAGLDGVSGKMRRK